MGKLLYSMFASLDGFVADAEEDFGWAEPDEEVHRFANGLERRVGMHLFGRRMYEVMAGWETGFAGLDPPDYVREFADIWRAADKIVYSTTLERPVTARTELERTFDPEVVRELKAAADRDLSVGGPDLAGQALRSGLVDELHLFVAPVVVGAGKPWLPGGLRLTMDLLDERRFAGGMVYLRYGLPPF